MNTKRNVIIVVAVAVATLLASGYPALAWDVNETLTNNTGHTAEDLTKIVEGTVTMAITNRLGTPSITNFTTPGGTTLSIIHWGPGGTPVLDGGSVLGCYNATGSTKLYGAYWTDANSVFIGRAAVEVSVTEWREGEVSWVDVEHTWRDWTGTGFPPMPEDDLGDFLGPITGTEVYYAITNIERSLEELTEDLNTNPDITWVALPDFQLNNGGDTASIELRELSRTDFVLLRFVLSGEGIRTPTIHQFQRSPDTPTVSQWGLIVMGLLLLVAGAVVIMRRSKTRLA
jgi:hypothetical protein